MRDRWLINKKCKELLNLNYVLSATNIHNTISLKAEESRSLEKMTPILIEHFSSFALKAHMLHNYTKIGA